MARRWLLLCCPLLVATGLTSPSSADGVYVLSGETCGFVSSNDPSGVINQDPNAQFGVMNGGPSYAASVEVEELPGPVRVVQHCWIQVNNGEFGHFPIPTAHCDFEGDGAAGGACHMAYTAGPTDNVYLCSMVVATASDTITLLFDGDDDPSNGAQCDLAISTAAPEPPHGPDDSSHRAADGCTYVWTEKAGGVYVTYC